MNKEKRSNKQLIAFIIPSAVVSNEENHDLPVSLTATILFVIPIELAFWCWRKPKKEEKEKERREEKRRGKKERKKGEEKRRGKKERKKGEEKKERKRRGRPL
jgi:Na+/melibiose symporter-like transporter